MSCNGFRYRPDPGPCPVDDAPHTTCTSPDYVSSKYGTAADQTITVPLRRPLVLETPTTPEIFTTATYRGRRKRPTTPPVAVKPVTAAPKK